VGDIIINEYASDNTATGNDFVELLTLKDHLDLRGLRISDNEYATSTGTLNTGEGVMVLGSNTYLSDVPRGTLIAVWTLAAGVTTDTTVNAAANDFALVLAPGTGASVGTDGLGGTANYGWSVSGDAIYLYLPGPNGNSTGSDNIYLDFVSWEADNAVPPPGLFDLNLVSVADNAFFKGNTATASDSTSQWTRYDGPVDTTPPPANFTPGRPNPGQNLTALRQTGPSPAVTITQSGGTTAVTEGGAQDSYAIALATVPTGAVTIGIVASTQIQVSLDGVSFAATRQVTLNNTSAATVHVRAVNDTVVEGPHSGQITHAILSTLDPTRYPLSMTVPGVSVTIGDDDEVAGPLRIRNIQGLVHRSPVEGQNVANVPGIVTVVDATGFYMQDPFPDSDPATSEGIFVFTGSLPSVGVGDSILVSGLVSEIRPDCTPCDSGSWAFSNLTITQLIPDRILTTASNQTLPAAVLLGSGGRPLPLFIFCNDATLGAVEQLPAVFDPGQDGLDFFESLEGMRVQIWNALVTGPTTPEGEIVVLADGGAASMTKTTRGGARIDSYADMHPERLILNMALVGASPSVGVGDSFSATIEAVVTYASGGYRLLPLAPLPDSLPGERTPEQTDLQGGSDHLMLATLNVNELSAADGGQRLTGIAERIVQNLASPDILLLTEVLDDSGPLDNGVVGASNTLGLLIDAIAAAGGPNYASRQVDPGNNQDGGGIGGNARVVFLFDPERVTFVDRPGGSATTPVTVLPTSQGPRLSESPGRVAPEDPAFANSAKPLAAEFLYGPNRLFLVGSQFVSKSGDQPLAGRFQPPSRSSESLRAAQAAVVSSFVQSILAIDPAAHVVVLGDLNDFPFSPALAPLDEAGLISMWPGITPADRYSRIVEGNAWVSDHILVSASLADEAVMDVVHTDADDPLGVSDHDALIVQLTLDATPPTLELACTPLASATRYAFTVTDARDANPTLFIRDSASAFVAGPYHNGDTVLVRINPKQAPYVRPMAGDTALVQLRGSPVFRAIDSIGNAVETGPCTP